MEIIYQHFELVTSTNDWAKAHLATFPPESITCISADFQTQGRGQYGREWISPHGVNLYASYAFFRDQEPLVLVHLLAHSIKAVLEELGVSVRVKQPNDLFVGSKKIAGILCETVSQPTCSGVVIGVGLNVNMTAEDLQKIDQPATSLLAETGKEHDLQTLLHAISHKFALSL